MTRSALVGMFLFLGLSSVANAGIDPSVIEKLTGLKGTLDPAEGVFKVSYARSDLAVTVAGVRIPTPMGLVAWASFQPANDQVMVMGDMVVTEDQVNPVLDAALANGLDVTALHNHFSGDSPRVMFMHLGGAADEVSLATAVGKVFAQVKSAGTPIQVSTAPVATASVTTSAIDSVIGASGSMSQNVYKVTIGRKTEMNGISVGKTMGVNT